MQHLREYAALLERPHAQGGRVGVAGWWVVIGGGEELARTRDALFAVEGGDFPPARMVVVDRDGTVRGRYGVGSVGVEAAISALRQLRTAALSTPPDEPR